MQFNYVTCELPSNGKIYPIKEVHIRPKTIFDIKTLLNSPEYYLKTEIDTLQNCIDPKDKVDVYSLCNQDVVYLLYKLRALSNDSLFINYKGNTQEFKISELKVNMLDSWNNEVTLPESGIKATLSYKPISSVFNLQKEMQEFLEKYPDYQGDVANTVTIINSILMIDNITDKDNIRNKLNELSWKDSVYLISEIDKLNKADNFGVVEEVSIFDKELNKEITVPIQIDQNFFRAAQ